MQQEVTSESSPPGAPPPDAKTRFSSRVDDYVRYRPRYPQAIYDLLRDDLAIGAGSVVADVGSGTGIFCEPLLVAGCTVFGVEPNAEMRGAAERLLARHQNFHSVNGSAEATTLPDGTADLVACAQAFHWFDGPRAAAEFRRIARPGGAVAIVWNQRRTTAQGFLADYERLLVTYGTDYQRVAREHKPMKEDDFAALFGVRFRGFVLPNAQSLDLAGLRGRVLSASYTPAKGKPGHDELLDGVADLFDRYQVKGQVTIPYDTEAFVGRLA
jgi:SAM-dependent methyltransferase